MQMLGGRGFIQRYSGLGVTNTTMKNQAVRINMTIPQSKPMKKQVTDCECVPIFRLTRIKHPQDFSDTFLLEVRSFWMIGG